MRRLLPAVAAIVVVASGCGSAENDPNLAAAAAKTEQAGSSRIAVAGSESQDGGRIDIECSGEADYARKRLQMSCDYGDKGAFETIALGGDTYMRGDLFGFGVDAERWVKLTADESFADALSPQRLLSMLRGASRETARIGDEEVRGVDSVRYRFDVECEQVELFDCEDTTIPVDVWIDDEGLVRRIEMDDRSEPLSVEFYDFGLDVGIEAPPADQVDDIEKLTATEPCRPAAGSPLTGDDVSSALRRQGIDVHEEDECAGDVIAALYASSAENAPDQSGFAQCLVFRTATNTSSGLGLRGGRKEEVANVRCATVGDELAGRVARSVAELERRIRP